MFGVRLLGGHITAKHASTAAVSMRFNSTRNSTLPKEKLRGGYQHWKPPVYVAPIEYPLEKGADYSFQDGRPVYFTAKRQLDRKLDDIRLGKKVVALLSEIRDIESAHQEAEVKAAEKSQQIERRRPTPKGNQPVF